MNCGPANDMESPAAIGVLPRVAILMSDSPDGTRRSSLAVSVITAVPDPRFSTVHVTATASTPSRATAGLATTSSKTFRSGPVAESHPATMRATRAAAGILIIRTSLCKRVSHSGPESCLLALNVHVESFAA